MIIDSHVHLFPHLGGANGCASVEEHLARIQRILYWPANPPRRKSDNSVVRTQTLWDGKNVGPEGLKGVGLKAGKYGRIEWTADGEELYLQWFPPSLADLSCSPEYMMAEMDYAGINVGVLQNAGPYGILNDFFADCVRQYPQRYLGLGQVRESRAHTDEQLSELNRCATVLGLKGLFYQTVGFWENGYRDNLDDVKYRVFWEEVRRLGLVIFWAPGGVPSPSAEAYTDQLRRIHRVLERHAGIACLLTMAFPLGYYAREGRYRLPDVAYELGKVPNFYLEITYPITYGGDYEYPYAETWPFVQQLYDWFGPERLVWGSDMPNVLRYCTYHQSYEYLRHCSFLSPADFDLLLGENLVRLFGLTSGV